MLVGLKPFSNNFIKVELVDLDGLVEVLDKVLHTSSQKKPEELKVGDWVFYNNELNSVEVIDDILEVNTFN